MVPASAADILEREPAVEEPAVASAPAHVEPRAVEEPRPVDPHLFDASRALSRLNDLAAPRGGGAVDHTCSPQVLMMSLSPKHRLRSSCQITEALALAAPFLLQATGGGTCCAGVAQRELGITSG